MPQRGTDWRARPWRVAAWGAAGALLLAPLAAMRVTDQVAWDGADFALAGALVVGVGVAAELALRGARRAAQRAAIGVALGTALLLAWANAAVGLVGSEDNPANRMVAGVLAIGLAGAFVARLRPDGMARALVATALAQGVVGAAALVAAPGGAGPVSVADVVALTGFFSALWLLSAWLFRRAARAEAGAGAAA